jgi:hypothetical protein
MEHLSSRADATGCNRSQMLSPRKRLKQADRQRPATYSTVSGRLARMGSNLVPPTRHAAPRISLMPSVACPRRQDLCPGDDDPSLKRTGSCSVRRNACPAKPVFAAGIHAERMERLWSPAGATSSKHRQIGRPPKPRKQAKSVAVGCDWLPRASNGKEGVGGSSPSEGFEKNPANGRVVLPATAKSPTFAGTFSDWRALAGTGDVLRHSAGRVRQRRSRALSPKIPGKKRSLLPVVARN